MRSRKRTIVVLIVCAALIGLLAVGMSRAFRQPMPLDHAQAVIGTTYWQNEVGNPRGFPLYFWSGSNDLTYIAEGKDRTPHLFRHSGIARTNTAGTEGPAVHLGGGYAGQLSPDGKWFVEWHQNRQKQRVPTFVAVDGTRRVEGQATWGTEGIWTPQSDAMLCSVWNTPTVVDAYVPTSGTVRKITFPGVSHFVTPQRVDAAGRLVGFAEGNWVMHYDVPSAIAPQNYPLMSMARVDPIHPDAGAEQWKVRTPENVNNGTCVISPSGDRLLWVLHGDTMLPLIRKLRSYIPGQSTAMAYGNRWLVSGLHGENMHEIAAYPIHASHNPRVKSDPYSHPRWLPDSKHISFVYQDALYTCPVD